MSCVRSVEYLIVMNGIKWETFKLEKGLGQGDPLSPYLFLLCLEGFSSLLKLARREESIRGVKVGKSSLTLTHIFFTEDSILFGDASVEGAHILKVVINEYEGISGS